MSSLSEGKKGTPTHQSDILLQKLYNKYMCSIGFNSFKHVVGCLMYRVHYLYVVTKTKMEKNLFSSPPEMRDSDSESETIVMWSVQYVHSNSERATTELQISFSFTISSSSLKTSPTTTYYRIWNKTIKAATLRGNEQKHLSLSCSERLSCDYFSLLFSSLATNNIKVERWNISSYCLG